MPRQSKRAPRWLTATSVLLLSPFALTGCGSDPALQVEGGGAGMALIAPRGVSTWKATIGSYFPCRTGDEPVVITKVDPVWKQRGTGLTAFLRTTPEGARKVTPMGSALGTPPGYAEPYAAPPGPGEAGSYTQDLPSQPVTTRCPLPRPEKGVPFQELQVAVGADRHGAHLTGLRIHYTVDGEKQTEEVPAEVILCGSDADPYYCKPQKGDQVSPRD